MTGESHSIPSGWHVLRLSEGRGKQIRPQRGHLQKGIRVVAGLCEAGFLTRSDANMNRITTILTFLIVSGCGTKPQAPATVEGTVHFLGRPLAGGMVVFTPDRDRGTTGKPIAAEVLADGRYELPSDKLSAGWYRVSISDPPAFQSGFPATLRRPDRSGLSREIHPGRDHRYDFHIDVAGR